jgi:hypothetical protein
MSAAKQQQQQQEQQFGCRCYWQALVWVSI